MEIRIDHIRSGEKSVVHIAGRLSSSSVAQLKQICAPIESPFYIDLSSLKHIDDEGIEAIRAIVSKGAKIRGAQPFIEMLIKGLALDHPGGEYQSRFAESDTTVKRS